MSVPDGDVDPDTGHCRAALDGDCAPAATATFLWAAGVTEDGDTDITENHLHFAMGSGGPDGTTAVNVLNVLRRLLALTQWILAIGPPVQGRALLIGYVKPNGNGHMVCVVSDPVAPTGLWLHDPCEDERQPYTPSSIAALNPNLIIRLVPKVAT